MDKLSYAIGMSMASNLVNSGLKQIDVESFVKAFTEVINNTTPSMSPQEANQLLQDFFSKRQDEMLSNNLEAGRAFLEENKKKENVVTLDSGLQYEILKEGNGVKPKATDSVKCHYHGTLLDGSVFDSSVQRGQPAVFGVNQVIKGWVEALQLMPVGSIEPNTTLIFEVELLGIE